MRRLVALALVAGVIALPLCAQRSSGHSGSGGHSAQTSRGGSSAPVSRGFGSSAPRSFSGQSLHRQASPARFATSRPPAAVHSANRGGSGNSGDPERNRHRRPYVSPYGATGLYGPGYGALGWINPYYSDSTGSDDSAAAPASDSGGYDSQPGDQGQLEPSTPYPSAVELSHPSTGPESEEAVTIIFKDGRPAEQIHNYILTRSTLIVGDRQHREIPTDQLDLIATAKANQDAGVDFRLPDAPR